MSIDLPADVQPIVERAIASGRCADEADVVRQALHLFEQFERRRDDLKRQIEDGIHSGPSLPAELVFEELERFAHELAAGSAGAS